MTSRWPCWCIWTKKERPYWYLKLILRELNSILMQTICFGLSLSQATTLYKIENNISYSSSFPTVIHGCDLQYRLSFADFILLFSSTVFSLFLQSPFFVRLHIILQITSRWPCWCFRIKKAKKEVRCWFTRLILRELNSLFVQRVCFILVLRQMTTVS